MALTPGSRLGAYEITAPLGEGGMGQVFRAREAKTLAALNHPNIAHIHGLEESAGVTALVMELVDGGDLSERVARGAISAR